MQHRNFLDRKYEDSSLGCSVCAEYAKPVDIAKLWRDAYSVDGDEVKPDEIVPTDVNLWKVMFDQ